VATALEALPFGGPVDEAFHVVAVLPGELEETWRRSDWPLPFRGTFQKRQRM